MKYVLIVIAFSSYMDAGVSISQEFNNHESCMAALEDIKATRYKKLGSGSYILLRCYPLGKENKD